MCLCVTKNSTNSGSNNKQWPILLFLPKYFWKKVFAPPCSGAPGLSPSFGGTTLILGFHLSSRLWPHGPKRAAVARDTPSAFQEESGGSPPSSRHAGRPWPTSLVPTGYSWLTGPLPATREAGHPDMCPLSILSRKWWEPKRLLLVLESAMGMQMVT